MMAVVVAFIALLVLPARVLAADPSLMRLLVVPSAGQLSLVVEMSDEPFEQDRACVCVAFAAATKRI